MALFLATPFPSSQLTKTERLDGVLDGRVLTLDAGLHDGGVAEDEDGGGADEPEDGAEGGREPEEGDADDEEARVERLLRDDVLPDRNRVRG